MQHLESRTAGMNPFFLLNKPKQTMRLLFFSAFTFATLFASGQDSSRLRISLLTCTPGQELYSTFGHTAIRVIDSNSLTDYVYNFGTFDFEDPNFYLKFVKGKLLYFLSAEPYADFAALYRFEGRGITEQLLNLDAAEKDSTRRLLNQTLREENRYYLYDFFFDNCTTRPRDIIVRHQHPRAGSATGSESPLPASERNRRPSNASAVRPGPPSRPPGTQPRRARRTRPPG